MTTTQPTRPIPVRSIRNSGSGSDGPRASTPTIDPFKVLRKHVVALSASGVFGIILGVIAWFILSNVYPLFSASVMFKITPALEDPGQTTTGELNQEDAVIRLARTEMMFLLERQVLRAAAGSPDVKGTDWAKQFVDNNGVIDVDEAVDELEEDLVVRYIPDTNLFEVRWSAHSRYDVPLVLNAVRQAYLAQRQKAFNEQFNSDLEVFTRDENQIKQQLETLEQEITDYISQNGILTLNQIRDHPITFQVNALNELIANTEAQLVMLQTQQMQIAAKLGGEFEATAEDRALAEQDPITRQLASLIATFRTQKRERILQFGRDHRSIKDIEIQLQAVEEEFTATIEEIMARNLNAQFKQNVNTLEAYAQMLDERKGELAERDEELGVVAGKVATYESMERRRDALHAERERAQEAVTGIKLMRQRSSANRVQAVFMAETPREKSFPKPEIIIPLGFLLVVGLTLAVVFLREFTDKRVKSASDLEVMQGANVLGVIPDIEEDPTRIERPEFAVRKEPHSVMAESYRQACTPILKSLEQQGHRSVVVVGGMPGSGSTTVISNLSAFIAAGGKRVLAIDANFRRPALMQAFGLEEGDRTGLGDVLNESAAVNDAIVPAGDGIDVMGAGTPDSRVFERLSNGVFETMVAELRSRYDFVLVDAPPAVVAGDAMVLANKTDASVLVVRANQEQKGLVARLINQLAGAQSELLGIVLNRPRWTAGGYFKKNYATMAEYAAATSS